MFESNIKNNSKYARRIRLRKMVASFLSLSLIIVSVYVYSKYAHAAITKEISYQGKLTNSSGVAVADGSYNMVISLYTVASGGTPVWTARGTVGSPTTRAVTVTNGIFSIMIGDTAAGDNAINLDFNSTYYLGIKVGSDSEMSPRKKVGASGYAFNSDLLDGLDSATSGANAHIVTTDTSGNLTVSGDVNVNGGDINSTTTLTLNPTGNLNFQSSSYYVNESGQMVLNTDETINGIDINAGAISDVTTFSSTYLATGASYVDIIGSAELRMGGTSVLTSARALQNITAATVDNLYLNGTTIGHTSDTDLLNLASNMLTVNGTLDLNGPIDLDVSVNDYAANFYNSNTGAAAGGLYIRSDGTGNLLTLNASGTDVVTISSTQASFNVPTSFTASGDVSMAYDLIFTNQTASNIKTNAPFTIEVGELFESNDLTLRTFNNGDVVLDAAGGVTLMQPQPWMLASGTSALNFQNSSGTSILNIDSTNNRVGIGTTSPVTRFHISDTSYTFSASGLSFGDGDTGFYESADDTLQVYVAGFNRLNFTSNGIYPSANDTRDLGSDSLRWRDIFSVDGFFSGNVGIGTTSPAEILDVNGRVRLAQTTAPGTVTDKMYNVSGNLYWNGVNLSGGGALPSGTSGQTLRHNGTSWIANSVLYNNGTNVGIGTTSPAYKFDVEGTIQAQVDNTYAFRIFENSGDNFRGGLGLENNGDAYLNITSDSGIATKISTNGNSYFMGGNFGIGTSNPGAMLAVSKTYSTAVASEQYGAFINTAFGIADTGLKQGLRLNTGSNITSGTVSSVTGVLSLIGNNGSGGTTDYAHALWTRVDSGAGHVTNNAYGLMVNDGSGAGTIGTQYGVYVFDLVKGSTNNFAIYTAGSTKSYFGGNVGIGTTSPARTLDVNGAIRIGGQIYSPGTYAGFFSDGGSALPVKVGSLAITSDYGNSAPTNGLYVQGNVGIGTTSPGKKLDVNGDVILSGLARSLQIGDGSGANLYFNNTSNNIIYGSNQFQFNTNQTQGFTFNGGNVGIGTTNPIAVLEVNKSDSSTSLWGRGEELIIRNSNGTNNTWSGIGFRGTSSGSIAAGISAVYYDTTNAYARLQFGTRGAAGWDSDVLVLNNGLVGINTTSPAEALDVNGRLRLAQTTAPGTVTDKMYNVSGNLYWNGVNLTGGGALPSGTSGQTLRNNGSGWVANSLLYNDGTNIGIGTTNPSKRFQVTDTYNIYIAGSGLGTGANIYSDNTMYLGTSTANSINLETADTTRLTVGSAGDFNFNSGQVFLQQSTGNLGIGTTNPANFKLQIAGNLGPDADNTYNLGSGTYRWANVYATNIAGAITPTGFTQGSVVFAGTGGLLTQNNGSFFWDNLNGRLGIGTSSPSSSLEVANGNITFGANDITSVGNIYAYSNQGSASNANFSFNNDANTGMFSSGDDTLNFSTAGTERLRISASGSVGIGTTNPEGLLNIVGDNTNLGLKVGSTYIDLPTGQRLSNSMIADDLLFYLPMQNSLSSSRGNTDYYTRTDTSSGSSATYTADSGYITHDYVYNNTPRFEKTNIGKGVWVENGRRNLFQYASFEDGGSISGWTNSGLETFTTTTGYKKHQSYSATLGDTNATGGNAYRSHTLTSGQSYPFYCYALNTTSGSVRSAVDSSVVELYANGAIATSYKPVEGGWYKISGTVTGTGGAINYGVNVKASKQIQLDGCQIEADYNTTNGVPYETSLIYNNGTNQRNRGEETLYYYAWRGTGNTESSDFLIDPAKGTVSFWWRPEWPYDKPATDLYLMQVPNVIQIFYSAADDKVYAQMYNGSNWTTVSVSSPAQTFVGGTDHYVSVRWDATSGLVLNFDGIEYVAAATSWTAQTQQMTTSTLLYVGSKSSAGGRADSLISDFAIFGRSLTKAEVLQIYNDKAPIEDYQRSDLVMLQQSNRTYQRGSIRVSGELYGGSVSTGILSTSYISTGYVGLNNSSNFSSHIVLHLPFEGTIDGSRKEVGTFQRTDASSGSAVALDENSLKYVSKNANEPRIDRGFDSNNYYYDTGTKTGNFGIYMEESRKNILLNSSFESTPSEWSASSGCSVSQSTGKSLHGTYSGNMTSTAACRVFQTVDLSEVTAGTKHQVSAYVWRNEASYWGADISTSIASLYARTDDGLTPLSTTYTPLGDGWYRLTGEFDSTAVSTWDVGVYLPSASRNIYVDGIQVERSAANGSVYFPTTYVPTTTAEITRAGEKLSYPVPASYKSEKGGFSFWFKPQWTRAITSDNTDKYLLYIPNELRVRLDATNDRFSIDHWNGSAWVTTSTTSTTDVTRYGWNHLSCGWYWNYNRCYLNGNGYTSSASWTPQDPTGKTLYIGSDDAGAYQANAQIAGLAVFDAYLTPEQQTQLYYNRGEFEDYYRTDITRLVDSTSSAIQNGSLYLNGTVGMGSGTAALPSLTFTGDKNTGIYNPIADTLGLSTGGTERLRIDANGNVGIGTTSPQSKLQILGTSGDVNTYGIMSFDTDSGLNDVGVKLGAVAGAGSAGYSFIQSKHTGIANDGSLALNPVGGSVGIGTTSPIAKINVVDTNTNQVGLVIGAPLASNEVTGIGFQGYVAGGNSIKSAIYHQRTGTWGTGDLHFALNGVLDGTNVSMSDVKMTIKNSGNVGIGTTSPGTKIDVVGGAIRTDNQLISTIATGTAPLAVSSTTLVSNLNADLWDGNQFASYLNQAVLTTSSPTFSRVYTTGRSSSWGSTNGIDTGGMNVTMGTGSSATWLISGTSGGTFRAGIQSLDADGTLRIYSNSSFISINGSTISNATWGGNAIADGYVADTITISGGTIGSNNISGTLTTTGALTIGDGGDTIAVNSSSWDVSTAGAFSGVTTIEMSGQLTSTLATGTAPFAVTSTTVNTNLNADMLDGLHSSSFLTANQTITLSGDASGSGTTSISVTNNLLNREDNRAINPAELGAGKMRFGFTSWANNSSSPYADFIHMRSYTDGSGGSDNLLMFNKSTIAMRLWQQAYGSATDYANYRDVVMTDQNSANVTLAGTLTMNGAGVLGDGGDDIAINSNDWDISSAGAISGITTLNMSGQLTSTLATGTAPLAVTSTTLNTNLNADLLDGQHGSYYATASSISGTDNYIPRFNGTSALENSNIYDNGTNIGIGTTSPGEKLDLNNGILKISRASATDNDSPGITNTSDDDFTYNGLYLNHYGFGFHRPTPYAGSESGAYVSGYYGINMFTSGLNRLVIEQDGNVGIGTSDPGYLFDVNGNTNINGNLIISGTVDGYDVSAYGTYFIGSAGTSGQVWTSDGTGAGYWAAAGSGMPSGTEGQMLYNNAGTWTAFSTMYWDDTNSRLGIGTTTPGASLDIFGTTNGLRLSYNSSNYANLSTGSTGILTMTSSDTSQSSITLGAGTATDQLVLFDGNTRDFYVGQDDTDDFFKIGSGAAVGSNTYLTINGSGNVGIGVTSPATYKFYVDWNSDGTSPAYVNNSNAWTNGSADYAEFFKTKDHDLAPGEAVCVDTNNSNAVKRCTRAEDPDLMGIVSTSPSVLGNAQPGREFDNNYVIVGMLGQVPAKVSTENGQINPGDSLTAATKPGYVMKANSGDSTVGVALEPIQQGEGIIQVLISRRNKSLTVEKVEEEVSQRIAEMDVEDQVNRIITEAQAQLTQSIATQSTVVADLASQLTQSNNKIQMLESQMELINAQNQAILDFAIALDVQKMIYKDEIGNVDLLDGKIAAAEMVTGVFTVKITDPEAKTIGEAVIRANNSNVEIKTKAVTDNSKIFVTAKVAAEYPLAVTQKKPSEGFVVSVKGNVTEDISFDWWIVESKDETEAVPTVKTQTTESFNGPVDSDGDGLVDEEENRLGTNPYSYDTDGDTFLDGDELRYGYNPLEASDGNKGDKISFSNPKFSGEINDNFIIINAAFVENETANVILSATGTVPSNRSITVFVYGPDRQISTTGTIADNNGNWEISLSKDFAGGQYEVYVCQTNTDGTITAKSAAFILAK